MRGTTAPPRCRCSSACRAILRIAYRILPRLTTSRARVEATAASALGRGETNRRGGLSHYIITPFARWRSRDRIGGGVQGRSKQSWSAVVLAAVLGLANWGWSGSQGPKPEGNPG